MVSSDELADVESSSSGDDEHELDCHDIENSQELNMMTFNKDEIETLDRLL